jgi:membrane-associated phospholipid phosphatase
MHWATDVLAGAAAGTSVGFLLPYLLHGRASQERVADWVITPVITADQTGLQVWARW